MISELRKSKIGKICKHWKVKKLEEVCSDIVDCLHSKKPDLSDKGNYVYLEVKNIGNHGKIDLSELKYVSREVYIEWIKRLQPQHKDIVITKTGRVGAVAMIPEDFVCCVGRNQVVIRANPQIINPYFLLYYLLSPNFKSELKRLTLSGTILDSLHVKNIPKIRLPFPEIEEQIKIVDFLYPIFKKIDNNHQMNETLEEIGQALFKSWFIDFEPFQEGEFEGSELGKIPKEWNVISISEIADYINGKAFTVKATPTGRMIIKIAELKNGKNSTTKYYNKEVENENIAFFDDILFAWSASLGIYRWHGEQGVINQHIFKVIPKDLPKWYVYYHIKYAMPWFIEIAKGKTTTMGHIKRSHLDEFKIIKPPDDIIERLDLIIKPIYSRIAVNNHEINILIQLRDLLLPQLISGRLRIENAEKSLEEIGN